MSGTEAASEPTGESIDGNRLGLFVGLLVALAATFLVVSKAAGVGMIALAPAYMFTPLVSGLAVCLVRDVPLSDAGLRVGRPSWLAAAAVVALPLVGLTLALSVAVPGIGFDPTADPAPGLELPSGFAGVVATLGLALVLGAAVNAVFALGEEFGWRGYLLWELAPLGFWKATGIIGATWGLWHAPVIVEGYNYPSFPMVGVAMMTAACVALSPVCTYLVIRAESVLAAAVYHGVFNGSAGLVLVYSSTDDPFRAELIASPVGLAGTVVVGLAAVAIAARGAPVLDRSFAGSAETDAGSPVDTATDD